MADIYQFRQQYEEQLERICDCATSVKQFEDVIQNFKNLHDAAAEVADILQKITVHFPDFFQLTKHFFELDDWPTANQESIMAQIQSEITLAKCYLSREVLRVGDLCEAAQQVEEAAKMKEVWQFLKQSENLAKESKETIAELDEKIEKMETLGGKLRDAIAEHEAEAAESRRENIRIKIRSLYNLLRNNFTNCKNQIENLLQSINLHTIALNEREEDVRDLRFKNSLSAFTALYRSYDADNAVAVDRQVNAVKSKLEQIEENDKAIGAIQKQKDVFWELMNQIYDLEERMAAIESIKEDAERFLEQYHQEEIEAYRVLDRKNVKRE